MRYFVEVRCVSCGTFHRASYRASCGAEAIRAALELPCLWCGSDVLRVHDYGPATLPPLGDSGRFARSYHAPEGA